ncbi:MAG: ABC transporter permease subunit [Anaerolineae bacterium]
MNRKPRPVLRTVLYAALIIVGVLVYAYGWQVTDINLEVPQEEDRQEQVVRALRGLLSPDLFERDKQSQVAYAHFLVPCDDGPPTQPEVAEGQPYIVLSPDCGAANDEIAIEVFNFHPYSDGFVRWTPPGRSTRTLNKFRTDGDGHFRSSKLRVPTVSDSDDPQIIEVEVEWPVGTPRPSEALKITIERMIETIFLALMATTFAIIAAIPISFIAAYNLMRQIRTPLGGVLAALLPLPIGWILGRQALYPVSDFALSLGNNGWFGIPVLAVMVAGLYFTTTKYMPRTGFISSLWLAGLVRYVQMIVLIILFLFTSGIISGIGTQVSLILGGVMSNILGTLADLLGLLLPVFSGLGGVLILGSLASTLLDALLDRVNNAFVQRALGLALGALAGGLLLYLAYRGVNNFYNPGEPVPFTVHFTVAGAVLGGGLGLFLRADYPLPVGLLIYYTSRTILNGLRSIEPLIMGIVFVIWVSIGPFAGVLALTLHSIAALGKLYSEQVESIDPGPIEAITATGATRLQTIIYGVVPQIVPPYIAFTLYRWDINVRMSTIIGFVGGGGIGFVLQQWINLLQYRQAGVAVLAIAIVVAALDYVSAQARERIT